MRTAQIPKKQRYEGEDVATCTYLRAMIADELHAFAADDRGWHMRSDLHRLDHHLERP